MANLGNCHICHTQTKSICGQCKRIFYCSIKCQKTGWPSHKFQCAQKLKLAEWNSDQISITINDEFFSCGDEEFTEANAALINEDYKNALRLYDEIKPVSDTTDDTISCEKISRIHLYKSIAYFKLGYINKAIKELDRSIKFNQKQHVACYMLSCCYAKSGRREDAISLISQAIKIEQLPKYTTLLLDFVGRENIIHLNKEDFE